MVLNRCAIVDKPEFREFPKEHGVIDVLATGRCQTTAGSIAPCRQRQHRNGARTGRLPTRGTGTGFTEGNTLRIEATEVPQGTSKRCLAQDGT